MIVETLATVISFQDSSFPLEKGDEISVEIDLDYFRCEIKEYAQKYLGMIDEDDIDEGSLNDYTTIDLLEELSYRGVQETILENQNILYSAALENILANLESIPVEEFENLINKYNL